MHSRTFLSLFAVTQKMCIRDRVVTDIDKSVEFYKKVFGLHVIMDFGANKTLTGGLALQTSETYKEFIGTSDISFGGNNFKVYFEEDDFDKFADRLKAVSYTQLKVMSVSVSLKK